MRKRLQSVRRQETGAVAIIVALVVGMGVLMGAAAISVDVGGLYAQRRQVQNGADAASLSLALTCVKTNSCKTSTVSSLSTLAGMNGKTTLGDSGLLPSYPNGICAKNLTGTMKTASDLPECSDPVATGSVGSFVDCPSLPDGMAGLPYVEAHTQTLVNGTHLLPPTVAKALGFGGANVQACARAGWEGGYPKSTLPVVDAQCAWDNATTSGTDFAPLPPYVLNHSGIPKTLPLPDVPVSSKYVSMILLHAADKKVPIFDGTAKCGATGPGLYTPGNFGWLDPADKEVGCTAVLPTDKGYITSTGKPGASATKGCKATLPGLVGSIVYIPIFTSVDGTGSNTVYTVDGVAAFYLAGFSVPSLSVDGFAPKDPSGAPTPSCGKDDCIWGWFLAPVIHSGVVDSGTDRGPKIVLPRG